MTKLLLRIFIKNEDFSAPETRIKCGILSGAVGVVINTLLACLKVIIGIFSNSISITADGLNNLFDAISSVISLVGFKMSGKPADDGHPFGHGRIEYITALVLAFIVILMGFELLQTSFGRIKNPEPTVFSYSALAVLIAAIFAKLWLAVFNRNLGKKINSVTLSAVVADSVSDIAATGVTLLALVLSIYVSFPIDAYMGLLVSALIIYSGISIAKDTLNPLLGEPPPPELIEQLENRVKEYEGVLGIHDLVIHSYGAGHSFASVHAEVSSQADIMKTHDTIDNIERDIKAEMEIDLVVHMDPLVLNDEKTEELRAVAESIAEEIDPRLTIHDFRVVDGPTHTNLIFDVVAPRGFTLTDEALSERIEEGLKEKNDKYFGVITVDHSYI